MSQEILLEVKNLVQHFRVNRKESIRAVNGISFEIFRNETFGLVGESGSGKSTTGRALIRLYQPTSGEIHFDGYDLSGKLNREAERHLRTKMQMIFQDPMASLNPRLRVMDIIAAGLDNFGLYADEEERKKKVLDMLTRVGLNEEHAYRFPSQFSGGQRQRIGIARALIMNPDLLIADEAISALDVSIQAQVVTLLKELQVELGISILFIAHDLSMVKYISDRIGVIHLGHLVEVGTVEDIFKRAVHPYTRSLLSAIPEPNPRLEKKRVAFTYEYETSGLDYNASQDIQLSPTHRVLARPEDLEVWQHS